MLNQRIRQLVDYGIRTGLISEYERTYTTNLLLEIFQETEYTEPENPGEEELSEILAGLLDEAAKRGILKDQSVTGRDLLDTKLMNCLVPRPSQVIAEFQRRYRESPRAATEYFYRLSQDSDYIRRYRVKKDIRWTVESPYGPLDISINLSKPEKDPKAIAAAKTAKQGGYPKCQLCRECVGYAGRLDFPARENHRIVPVAIGGAEWWFQYSPYVYYNEHCIVFNGEHVPMKIETETFRRLLDFVAQFPHYFVGSNADLPIVGGSILSHDHFQGGCYEFPVERAQVEETFLVEGFANVTAGIVHWPLSVIRLAAEEREELVRLAGHILEKWRGYTDAEAMIFAETEGEPHNTITPIARMRDGKFELDLVLRNNLTTPEHPLGLYHPHQELHHIKKENIGLIEVMGLAILPARLKTEMDALGRALAEGTEIRGQADLEKHADWAEELKAKYGSFESETVSGILRRETGDVFRRVLEDAGVYKVTEEGRTAFWRFIHTL